MNSRISGRGIIKSLHLPNIDIWPIEFPVFRCSSCRLRCLRFSRSSAQNGDPSPSRLLRRFQRLIGIPNRIWPPSPTRRANRHARIRFRNTHVPIRATRFWITRIRSVIRFRFQANDRKRTILSLGICRAHGPCRGR